MTLSSSWDRQSTVNSVTYIPGYDENSSSGGRQRNSAIPKYFDEIFHGDFRRSVPTTLGEPSTDSGALGRKLLEEFTKKYPNYRVRTAIEIGLDVNGRTIPSYEIQMSGPSSLSAITLEGGPGERNPFRNELKYIDGGSGALPSTKKGPKTTQKTFSVKSSDGATVEGVRGSIIFGGSDTYLVRAKQNGLSLATLASLLTGGSGTVPIALLNFWLDLPAFYSFVDFAVTADGAKLVRVWDASRYPAHALYVDGTRRDQTTFREGTEWTRDGSYNAFTEFAAESVTPGLTPFESLGTFGYKTLFRSGFGDHPVMRSRADGSRISAATLEKSLSSPLMP